MTLSVSFTSYTRDGKCKPNLFMRNQFTFEKRQVFEYWKYSVFKVWRNNRNNRIDNIDNNSLIKWLFDFHVVFSISDREHCSSQKQKVKSFW